MKKEERPMVYICSPYAGDVKTNAMKARQYCKLAVKRGVIPIAPHLLFPQFMNDNDPAERDLAMSMNLTLLEKCEELWVFGKTVSPGMSAEIEKAKELGLTVRNFTGV